MPALRFAHHAQSVSQVSEMVIVKFAKEDAILYCQLDAVCPFALGKMEVALWTYDGLILKCREPTE